LNCLDVELFKNFREVGARFRYDLVGEKIQLP
jgi:hypothetical protein